jgi:hypothetical protein
MMPDTLHGLGADGKASWSGGHARMPSVSHRDRTGSSPPSGVEPQVKAKRRAAAKRAKAARKAGR